MSNSITKAEESALKEMDKTAKRREEEKLSHAVERVQQAISDYRTQLEAIVLTDDKYDDALGATMVCGETTRGYYAQIMVNPKVPAGIMLKWDYPIFRVLKEDAPQGMWDELAREFGLASVSDVDL